jgi:hypothetical protein
MTLRMRGELIVMAGLALGFVVFGGCGSQDHEAKRLEMYREDSAYCSKYATKREEARELLAWTWPKGSFVERMKQRIKQETAAPEQDAGMADRMTADREACMLGQGWEKEWLVDLAAKEKARLADCERRHSGRLWVCR